MINQEDLEDLKELWLEGEYFDWNFIEFGRMAPIYELIFKTTSGKYYKTICEFDMEMDSPDFDESELCEVVPREVVKIEYVEV